MNYLIKSISQDIDAQVPEKSEILATINGNVHTRSIFTTGSKGFKVSEAKIISDGNTKTWYINGKLDVIKTKDDQTNCEFERSFSNQKIYEKKTCDGHVVRIINVGEGYAYEENCVLNDNLSACQSSYDGKSRKLSYQYRDKHYQIHSVMLDHGDGIDTYHMSSRRETANGEQVDYYSIDLPSGSPFPKPYHANWQLDGKLVQTGYISSIDDYASSAYSGKYHTSSHTIDIY